MATCDYCDRPERQTIHQQHQPFKRDGSPLRACWEMHIYIYRRVYDFWEWGTRISLPQPEEAT